MALEIAENLGDDTAELVLIGVEQNGTAMARQLEGFIRQYISTTIKILTVSLDKIHPGTVTLSEPMDFNQKNIIIIDDVSNSGKTLLYATKPLLEYHPRRIQTLVMIERMHRLFPIKPDYIGLSLATTGQDHIRVEIENAEITGVIFDTEKPNKI
ncbi:pyrimidine operon attenuation protein / uracil phosphoribosyltransferase [Arachidicoccus rhizosphaerae]|uniref:Pyrimidine operon attenuation protein / uracil phosphoribosyltransferase n=2 Tax=Arachidicoccus rhizosphaerae TaxID=551991 RepID=A0A1H3W0A5_9BACT|nr:pyrimidine operon attenuation protein / uracil phosphoribosyltransferase [Arachidicoccus rhizosphaerae]